MFDLRNAVLASKNVTELYNAIAHDVGLEAYRHFEKLVMSQAYKERRSAELDAAHRTLALLDVELQKRLQKPAEFGEDQHNPQAQQWEESFHFLDNLGGIEGVV